MWSICSRSLASMADSPMPNSTQGPGQDLAPSRLPGGRAPPVFSAWRGTPGGARQHDDGGARPAPRHSPGGAPVVVQHRAALRGAWPAAGCFLRHGPLRVGLGKIGLDPVGRRAHGTPCQSLRQHVLGQIVAGGPQPPGGDDQVGPARAISTAERSRWGLSPTTVW